jgi:hypothetical protein
MQTLEGYYKNGSFFALKPPVNISDFRRVIITILDESMREKPGTWAEFDEIVAGMSEKPRFEDFPRCQFGREPIAFEDV